VAMRLMGVAPSGSGVEDCGDTLSNEVSGGR